MKKAASTQTLNIQALCLTSAYPCPITQTEFIETHISWVFIAGDHVYKIKKPVDLGFLDYSSLEKRQRLCEEELRLNRRLAPSLYIDVVPVTGSYEAPCFGGDGPVIDYAVHMHAFAQSAQWDRLLQHGELRNQDIDQLATRVAEFHSNIERAGVSAIYGDPVHVVEPVVENFNQLHQHLHNRHLLTDIEKLETWSLQATSELQQIFSERKRDGFVRECHGDMHLRNIAFFKDDIVIFDGIEFNPNLRWIDVMSEVAFVCMDLADRGERGMAWRFLNTYLQITGDYAGLRVFRYYLVYRAMVRAKVAAIRLAQKDLDADERYTIQDELESYINLGLAYIRSRNTPLIITRGVSASGKSTITQYLLEQLGAVRLRSDVERKRIHDIPLHLHGKEEWSRGLYSAEATEHTYTKVEELARVIFAAGYPVIIDAANLQREQRDRFRHLANELKIPFAILDITAHPETLLHRIAARTHDVSDATCEVLQQQLANWTPLGADEKQYAIRVDSEMHINITDVLHQIEARNI